MALPYSVDENSTSIDGVSTHSCPAVQSNPLPSASRHSSDPLSSATSHHHHHQQQQHSRSKSSPHDKQQQQDRGLARHRRNSWMRSSIVRRAATVVDEEVEALCEKSPFLKSTHAISAAPDVAVFHRREITLGKGLGRGGFADVYAVAGLNIKEDDSNDCIDDDDDDDKNEDMEDQKRNALRRQCQSAMQTTTCSKSSSSDEDSRPKYAIKFLKKKLMKNTRDFQHAAIDLAVEAKYLASMAHRNIIKVRGLTKGGTSAFKTGKHDDFFIVMDYLEETLEHRIQSWKKRQEEQQQQQQQQQLSNKAYTYGKSLQYARQIADALAYLHDKSIVYRDLKPANLGFKLKSSSENTWTTKGEEEDTIVLFDFGLSRELPKRKGKSQGEEDLEDEETFHMSGVGTQRYMAPEIITTRRYNLKADCYSWSMVFLEMMTLNKPFLEFEPAEHALNVARLGKRPRLLDVEDIPDEGVEEPEPVQENQEQGNGNGEGQDKKPKAKKKKAKIIPIRDWPAGVAPLLEEAWSQDVGERLCINTILQRLHPIIGELKDDNQKQHSEKGRTAIDGKHDNGSDKDAMADSYVIRDANDREVVLEFPSHFSPRHQMSPQSQGQQLAQMQRASLLKQHLERQDSEEGYFGDKQSEASAASYLELTATSGSMTMHDSNSTT